MPFCPVSWPALVAQLQQRLPHQSLQPAVCPAPVLSLPMLISSKRFPTSCTAASTRTVRISRWRPLCSSRQTLHPQRRRSCDSPAVRVHAADRSMEQLVPQRVSFAGSAQTGRPLLVAGLNWYTTTSFLPGTVSPLWMTPPVPLLRKTSSGTASLKVHGQKQNQWRV